MCSASTRTNTTFEYDSPHRTQRTKQTYRRVDSCFSGAYWCAWRCTGVLLCARAQKRTKSNRNVCDLHVRLQPILHLDTQVEPWVLNKAPILRLHLSEKGTALILAPTLPNSVFGRTSVQVSLHFITRGTNEPHRHFWGAHSLVTTCVYTSVKTCIWIEICQKDVRE